MGNKNWIHNNQVSYHYIKEIIFKDDDDSSGELVPEIFFSSNNFSAYNFICIRNTSKHGKSLLTKRKNDKET